MRQAENSGYHITDECGKSKGLDDLEDFHITKEEVENVPDTQKNICDTLDDRFIRKSALYLVLQLPRDDGMVIGSHFGINPFPKRTNREIAQILGLDKETVRAKKKTAMEKLKKLIEIVEDGSGSKATHKPTIEEMDKVPRISKGYIKHNPHYADDDYKKAVIACKRIKEHWKG